MLEFYDKRFKSISLPISEVIRESSNVCSRTVLHECILTICTSHAALSETRAKPMFMESTFGIAISPRCVLITATF
jgi:hypothetical protein